MLSPWQNRNKDTIKNPRVCSLVFFQCEKNIPNRLYLVQREHVKMGGKSFFFSLALAFIGLQNLFYSNVQLIISPKHFW
jgi:hypothetical protein